MKLTQATIPMCPECGAELEWSGMDGVWFCNDPMCTRENTTHVYWGYHDVSVEVADALRRAAEPDHGNCGDSVQVGRRWLRNLADHLDPGKEGELIDESTQAVVVARLKALPAKSVAQFWRAFRVDRVRDFDRQTMGAVNQVLKNLEKEAGIR